MSDHPVVPFGDRLAAAVTARHSHVVLGLDPDPRLAGEGAQAIRTFCERLVRAAGPACVAVKLQMAWFERLGAPGWGAMEAVADLAASQGLLVIADGKRGDIGVTAAAYAQALLRPPFDALTVNPMLGGDAVQPFVEAARAGGRGVFLLVRTSNPGAAELQDLPLADGRTWCEALAERVAGWGASGVGASGLSDVGAVVGATVPEHLVRLRALMPHQPLLIPGVGAQGGKAEDLGPAFAGGPGAAVVAASRSIMRAQDPASAAEELRAALWAAAGG
ncbi:MAG: orotidine-5'-phosphate decarboxylase [Thermoleophilia bacterium]